MFITRGKKENEISKAFTMNGEAKQAKKTLEDYIGDLRKNGRISKYI